MLVFLGLNANLGAAILATPSVARELVGPLFAEKDLLPEVEEDKGLCPFGLNLNSLVKLSDRDMRLVLYHPALLKLGTRPLACLLSFANRGFQRKVFRNVSETRRQDLQHFLRQECPPKMAHQAQSMIKWLLFEMTEKKLIHPPPAIQRQLDEFRETWNAWWQAPAGKALQELTRLVNQLNPYEMYLTIRQVRRVTLLWALQDCNRGFVLRCLNGMSASGIEQFLEDLPRIRDRAMNPGDLQWNIMAARQVLRDAAQFVLNLRKSRVR
jgi:hypothetical protein